MEAAKCPNLTGSVSCSLLWRQLNWLVGKEQKTLGLAGSESMREKIIVPLLASLVLASVHLAQAQQANAYRVGVILQGGPDYVIVDGLKSGLRNLGFAEGKHYLLEIRDLKGDRKAAEEAARSLEREKSDLIDAVNTSVNIVVKGDNRSPDRVRCRG
jgi:hypothetical protein